MDVPDRMSETSTPKQLLIVALQDLYDAERAWLERLPRLFQRSPEALDAFIASEQDRSASQLRRLGEMLASFAAGDAMPNIWLRAILDDARRDSETIANGPLRAIAMVGAFRKGKQAERVSYETAIGLARALELPDIAAGLTQSRDEEADADAVLAQLLAALLQTI